MKTIKIKVVPTNLKKGTVPVNRYTVIHNGTVYDDTVYTGVSKKSGQPQPLVKATGAMIFSEIAEQLKHGYRVELPEVSAFLTLPGSVESMSAESSRSNPPVLVARMVSKGALKTCCQGPEFKLENVSKGATVSIVSVIDSISQQPDVITNGANVEVHVVGNGLLMPDLTDQTVGAYLADSSGEVLAKATVTESTMTTLVCVFPVIDLQAGTYRFCVASRAGLDPTQYVATVGRRNVQVVNAAEDEEVQHG